jgi:hypothetical protein
VPDCAGVFILTKDGEPRVEWDTVRFIATIEDVQYSRFTPKGHALSEQFARIIRNTAPIDYRTRLYTDVPVLYLDYTYDLSGGGTGQMAFAVRENLKKTRVN